MVDISRYVRFERVDRVSPTDRGLTAELHGERLRIEVVREDVVWLAISRGGEFEPASPASGTT